MFFKIVWKNLKLIPVKIEYSIECIGEELYQLKVKTDRFAWMVHIKPDYAGIKLSDNYFDLLPGETRQIIIEAPKKITEKLKVETINNCLRS